MSYGESYQNPQSALTKGLSDEDIKRIAEERNRLAKQEWEEWKKNNHDYKVISDLPYNFVHKFPDGYTVDPNHPKGIIEQMSNYSSLRPEANYHTINMIASDDPIVLNFLQQLGINPESTKRVTIVAENNKPLELSIESYAIASKSIGSPLTARPIT